MPAADAIVASNERVENPRASMNGVGLNTTTPAIPVSVTCTVFPSSAALLR